MEHDFKPEEATPWPETAGTAADSGEPYTPAVTAPAEAPARPRTPLLLGGTLVLLLTAGGTLALLASRETPPAAVGPAHPADASRETTVTRTAPPATAWADAAPRWTSNPAAWLGRTKGIAYEVSAAEPIGIWLRTVRPALVVRCAGGRAEVFVFTDSAAAIEANTDEHTVEYAFDDEAPTTMRWPDGAEHTALFAPDGGGMAQRLQLSRTFTFRFSPHNAQRVTARFNTSGLDAVLKPAARHCRM